jgi:nitronate monooxygenase/enoyl-[acyl-carrier protein] reductase II
MLRTRVCDLFGIRYPILQAGMASYVGPELVAAVSNAGGLGLLGGVDHPVDELERLIEATRERTPQPFGVNLVLAEPHEDKLDLLIRSRVPLIATSWGDPRSVVERAHAAGLLTLHQVETEEEAARGAATGVDALVAQGSDGGGHIGRIGTMALVPAVVDAAGGVPVLAAGGIADGRGVAAALMLGAEGAFIGTRFLATNEAPIAPAWKQALVHAYSSDAWVTDVPDLIWGTEWPGATGRALANDFVRRWQGREDALIAARPAVQARISVAEREGDARELVAWGGQSAALIHDIVPAGDLLERIVREAHQLLTATQ